MNTSVLDDILRHRKTVEVFISYSHKDEPLLNRLYQHLAFLEGQGIIQVWDDRQIMPGSEWRTEIENHLNNSPDRFMTT
jgi:TIR domain